MIAWENKKLIRGALKAAHVRKDYVHYEDLYQNAVLLYAEMLEKKQNLDRKTIDRLSFRKIIWHTLNELHKVKLICERGTGIEEAAELAEEFNLTDLLIIKEELKKMNEIERKVVIENIAFQRKLTEMDDELDLCRMTLHRVKNRVLKQLKKELS